MELKQFITTTLNDIFDGVAEAQKHANEVGGMINPFSNSEHHSDVDGYYYPVMDVEFDIAVIVINEDKTSGGIGVISGILNVGAKGEDNQINNQSSRIKFSVPVTFPVDKMAIDKDKNRDRSWGV